MNRKRPIAPVVLAMLLWMAPGAPRADTVAEVQQLQRAGKSDEAMRRLDQLLAAAPKDPQLRFLKGVLLAQSQRTAEAIAVFTLLSEDYPELAEPYNNLAVLYAGQGQYEKARVALEAAIRGNPGYATAYENIGDVYARLAAQAYTRALQLDAANAALPGKIAQLRTLFVARPSDAGAASAPASAAKTR